MVDDRDLERIRIQTVRDLQSLIHRVKIRISLMSDTDQKDFPSLFVEAADAASDRRRRSTLLLSLYKLFRAFSEDRHGVCRVK